MSFYWKPTFSSNKMVMVYGGQDSAPPLAMTDSVHLYLQYAQVCARTVRSALKEDARVIAVRRDEQGLKFAKWEAGKQGEVKNTANTRTVA
ncbi:hypothetical protein BG011_004130 [Mortierella polycephala]|uniref:Uncharacterized protein n=1 Tax=Mortierella polycephala TaxID=41804 RepID=A0A9P6U9R9_9FUNG|nr:hypothetical protein BG011_004130 [Mortierella polycephala]